MYNDRPEMDSGNAMAGLSASDNRAQAGGTANWGNPRTVEQKRWEEKYVGEPIAGSNPTAWIESKRGVEADVMAGLLREKELGEKQATASEWLNGAPDPNNPEYQARVPRSPFVKSKVMLSSRATLEERASDKYRSRLTNEGTSPSGAISIDGVPFTAWNAEAGGKPAAKAPRTYYLAGTQRGYEVDETNREQYWSAPGHIKGSGPPELSRTAGGGTGALDLQSAPKAGVAAAQALAFYEDARAARAKELHYKLGIDQVKLNSGFVDTTPQAGHHTSA